MAANTYFLRVWYPPFAERSGRAASVIRHGGRTCSAIIMMRQIARDSPASNPAPDWTTPARNPLPLDSKPQRTRNLATLSTRKVLFLLLGRGARERIPG